MSQTPIMRLAALVLLLGTVGILSSCNTVSGLGEDLQILGKKMEKKADSVYRGDQY